MSRECLVTEDEAKEGSTSRRRHHPPAQHIWSGPRKLNCCYLWTKTEAGVAREDESPFYSAHSFRLDHPYPLDRSQTNPWLTGVEIRVHAACGGGYYRGLMLHYCVF